MRLPGRSQVCFPFVFFCTMLLWLWGFLPALGAPFGTGKSAPVPPPTETRETAHFRIETSGAVLPGLDFWAKMCEGALTRLAPESPAPANPAAKYRVWVSPTHADFERQSGMRAELTMAVAYPFDRRMVLNAESLRLVSTMERFQTVGHEMVHLLLGGLEHDYRQVPLWLHEGLAQTLVRQSNWNGSMRLVWAHLLGNSIPMRRLSGSFPYGGPDSDLAYAQSASFTQFIATEAYSFPSVEGFFRALITDDQRAGILLSDCSDPLKMERLEKRWRGKAKNPINWILAAGSSTLLWGAIVLLFLGAYVQKRRHEKKVMEDWDPWEKED